jgi:hypothetical protein
MGAGEADRGKRGRQGQARPMGASEAGGGRRDRWGQARLVGAGEANGGRKPPGQIPSQHSPFGPRLSRQMKQSQTNKRKSKILLHVPNPKKIQAYSVNPNTQSETKEIQVLPVILSESNLLHKYAEFNSPEGLSESVCQHLRTCHVLDLDFAFGNGFMNRVVPES